MHARSTTTRPARRAISAAIAALLLSAAPACKRGEDAPEVPPSTEAPTPSGAAAGEASGDAAPTGEVARAEAPAPNPAPTIDPVRVNRRDDVSENRALAARLGLAPPDPLLVSDLLTRADVRELAEFRGELLETSLPGIPPGPDYNAVRLQADGGYGLALQVWQFDELRQLSAHYRRLRETYFDARDDDGGVANEGFTGTFQGIRHQAFLHRASKSVVVVTCAETICDGLQLRAIAQRIANRL